MLSTRWLALTDVWVRQPWPHPCQPPQPSSLERDQLVHLCPIIHPQLCSDCQTSGQREQGGAQRPAQACGGGSNRSSRQAPPGGAASGLQDPEPRETGRVMAGPPGPERDSQGCSQPHAPGSPRGPTPDPFPGPPTKGLGFQRPFATVCWAPVFPPSAPPSGPPGAPTPRVDPAWDMASPSGSRGQPWSPGAGALY
ncbi:proline-rich protein 2-like [Vulpes lagopus]|uniref:proline-rich protein 2-like n=1 Tax=Vulpes lagopus TaxID=494514 RepID=UPI001BC9F384|nr:proline-rich protein 2-like [Vulpes lagopus]